MHQPIKREDAGQDVVLQYHMPERGVMFRKAGEWETGVRC